MSPGEKIILDCKDEDDHFGLAYTFTSIVLKAKNIANWGGVCLHVLFSFITILGRFPT